MVTEKFSFQILNETEPIKLTESRYIKVNSYAWGLLTDYYLESVKINNYNGKTYSAAVIKVEDKSGQVTCLIKGNLIAHLFGLTRSQWSDIERLSLVSGNLFYRYFKDGLSQNFSLEQKLFYYFCVTNQRKDTLLVIFQRNVNTRVRDKSNAFLLILDVKECRNEYMELYIEYLKKSKTYNSTVQ